MIYCGGNIYTMENELETVEAVLVRDGKIEKTGSLKDITNYAPTEEISNLEGKTLLPSFIDPHGHVSMVGQMVGAAADLTECETHEDIIKELIKYKEERKIDESGAIFGFGYDHNFLPGGSHPTKEVLNQVSTTIPVYVLHTSAHMGCTNDKGLELGEITSKTVAPQGGVIGRVKDTDEPNGYLEETAMMKVNVKELTKRVQIDIMESMHTAQMNYLKNGITTAQDGATSKDNITMFKELAKEEKLLIDIIAYPLLNGEIEEIFEENACYANKYSNRFKLGGYKVVLDGSPQGKSAWLTKPYENSGDYVGYPWFKDEEVKGFMKKAITNNQQVLVHCNGDAAGDQFLSSYVSAYKECKNNADLRPVMIHCQTARADQFDIMAEYNMLPSIFTGHIHYWGDIHVKNLGHERGSNVSPVKWALDRNLVVNFHQDPPVTKPNPLMSVWAAVNRYTRGGNIIAPEQRCDVWNAMKAITINSAYSYFEEEYKGSIKEGKLADLVILNQDPFTIDTMLIKDIQVLETIKEGQTLFKA